MLSVEKNLECGYNYRLKYNLFVVDQSDDGE